MKRKTKLTLPCLDFHQLSRLAIASIFDRVEASVENPETLLTLAIRTDLPTATRYERETPAS
jgi:hypothetical protein